MLKLRVYDQRNGYFSKYTAAFKRNYEPFRDIQKQQIIIFLIMLEFNIFKYHNKGIVRHHYPVHHFPIRVKLGSYFKKYLWRLMIDLLTPNFSNTLLTPIKKLAFYSGTQNGFYMGFLITYTSLLFPIGLIGLGIYIAGIIWFRDLDNLLVPVISIIVAIWATVFREVWGRMESTLAYNFDMDGAYDAEQQRFEYSGTYVVDSRSKKVVKFDSFTVAKRRMVTDWPLIICAFILIGANFIFFNYLSNVIQQKELDGEMNMTAAIVANSIVGAMNGVVIVLLDTIYSMIVDWVVENWENHMYNSDMINSKAIKNTLFQFFTAYFNLFYYAFYEEDFKLISSQVTSIMISKNLLNILMLCILPWFKYYIKTCWMMNKWKKYRRHVKEKFLRDNRLEKTETLEELKKNPKLFEAYKSMEVVLLQTEQVERTNLMINLEGQEQKYYITLAIQYGYICMFSVVFPAASTISFLANLITIILTERLYSKVSRRSLSREMESIGVWNGIFEVVSFISAVVNASIVVFTSNGLKELGFGDDTVKNVLLVIFAEHCVLALKFILSKMIPNKPSWVRDRQDHETFIRRKVRDNMLKSNMKAHSSESKNTTELANLKTIVLDAVEMVERRDSIDHLQIGALLKSKLLEQQNNNSKQLKEVKKDKKGRPVELKKCVYDEEEDEVNVNEDEEEEEEEEVLYDLEGEAPPDETPQNPPQLKEQIEFQKKIKNAEKNKKDSDAFEYKVAKRKESESERKK